MEHYSSSTIGSGNRKAVDVIWNGNLGVSSRNLFIEVSIPVVSKSGVREMESIKDLPDSCLSLSLISIFYHYQNLEPLELHHQVQHPVHSNHQCRYPLHRLHHSQPPLYIYSITSNFGTKKMEHPKGSRPTGNPKEDFLIMQERTSKDGINLILEKEWGSRAHKESYYFSRTEQIIIMCARKVLKWGSEKTRELYVFHSSRSATTRMVDAIYEYIEDQSDEESTNSQRDKHWDHVWKSFGHVTWKQFTERLYNKEVRLDDAPTIIEE